MASKRQLYHPAPKAKAGERKGRKPLVQGRLTTTVLPTAAKNSASVSYDPKLDLGLDLFDFGIKELNHDRDLPNPSINSFQGHQNHPNDENGQVDLLITPRKCIPALTEITSPQPEPPSTNLDLSDADLGSTEGSALCKSQPVMVCDASYLAHSPDNTEVDVVINYENSPATVVCHTPGRLEKSFRSTTDSMSNKQSITINVPTSVGMMPARLFTDSHAANNEGAELISHQSRGIIKEILAQEIDSENEGATFLYSQNSSSSQNPGSSSPNSKRLSNRSSTTKYPLNSSPIDNNDFDKPSNRSSENNNLKEYNVSSNHSPPQKQNVKLKERLQQKKSIVFRHNSDGSDSETLSLYEYVTPKKPMSFVEKSKNDSDGTSVVSQESVSSPAISKSNKKVKSKRVIPSRYKQVAAVAKLSSTSLGSKDSSTENAVSRPLPRQKSQIKSVNPKSKIMSKKTSNAKQTPSKSTASQTTSTSPSDQNQNQRYQKVQSPRTVVQDQVQSDKEEQKVRQTSTPTHDYSGFPNYMDASSIQSVSTLSVDASMSFSRFGEQWDLKQNHKGVSFGPDKGDVGQEISIKHLTVQLDIEYSRYIQACFLISKAHKVYTEQDKKAVQDLSSLWTLVEKQREEVSKAEKDLLKLKQFHHIDQFLDRTSPELMALDPRLPQVEADYVKLCQALDTTRHQIPTKDIHIPYDDDDDVRYAYEQKMESALNESEALLNQINKCLDNKLLPLTHYRTGLEAVKQNVSAIEDHLREGQTDLEKAQGLCTRLASLTALDT